MPNFDGAPYTQLTAVSRGDIQGVIKDISETQPESQTKFAAFEDILKYGPWASKVLTVTASGTINLLDTDPFFVEIDPNGSNRDVNLPVKGNDNHAYIIRHVGSANTITVKRSGGLAISTLKSGDLKYIKPSAAHDFVDLPAGRKVLAGNSTYYVRTDGNDANTGLTNSAGGAFRTIQKAVDEVSAVDPAGYTVTIQVADGTYAENVVLKNTIGDLVTITGNTGTPANVVTSQFAKSGPGTTWLIQGFRFTASSATRALQVDSGAFVQWASCDFGSGYTYHIECILGANVQAVGNYSISSGASAHLSIRGNSTARVQSRTITLTGTPTFGSTSTFGFVEARYSSTIFINGNTFSGSGTGRRYYVDLNAVVQSAGATLPGGTAGVTDTGGIYA